MNSYLGEKVIVFIFFSVLDLANDYNCTLSTLLKDNRRILCKM